MRCSRANEQLQLYIDQRLPLDKVRTLEAHLSTCAACRRDFFLLEEMVQAIHGTELVVEPTDLTMNIMRRIVVSTQQEEKQLVVEGAKARAYDLFRPSLTELCSAVLMATIATCGVFLTQPSLRATLAPPEQHGTISLIFINIWHLLSSVNSDTLMLGVWILGTILGVWITLALAGTEMRAEWFKAMTSRLPVW